tara:strand:- start:3701 stop:3931 length:231 start_codon:yes stop_codon:yes gene_type:complete
MNIVISEKDSIEKKAKIIYEDLKKATKNLELLINQEKDKKDKKIINSPDMPPAGITSQRYAHIDNHLGPFINSLRN